MANSQDVLDELLGHLEMEISISQHHAALGKALESALTIMHWNSAFEFWSFTLKAHFESGLLGLTRVLDADARAVSLQNLPSAVEARAGKFVKISSEQVRRELLPEIVKEVQDLVKLIEPLKKRRDEMYAHNALHKTLGDKEWNIAWADLDTAYTRVRNLVNRVSVAYKDDKAVILHATKDELIAEDISAVLNPLPVIKIAVKGQ